MKNRSDARHLGKLPLRIALGAAIRKARVPHTQEELAARLGCPQSSVSMWENGKVSLTVDQVRRIEAALDLSAGALLIDAGCVDVERHPEGAIPMKARRSSWRAPAGTAGDFPSQLAAWMAEFLPVIEAIGVLRTSEVDNCALEVLLASGLVQEVRLSWELWEALAASASTEEDLVRAIGWSGLAAFRWALWGDAVWGAPLPVNAPVLRLLK